MFGRSDGIQCSVVVCQTNQHNKRQRVFIPQHNSMSNGNNRAFDGSPMANGTSPSEKSRAEISERQQVLSTLFFGLLNPSLDHPNAHMSDESIQLPSKESKQNLAPVLKMDSKSDNNLTSSNDPVDGVLNQIDRLIPHDPIALRQSSLYKGTLQLLQWQRDNYLVGGEYADWRRDDRIREQRFLAPQKSWDSFALPFDEKAISHDQISAVASSFIPTKTVQNLLTPIVTGLFDTETGVLFDPIKDSTVNLIVQQQTLLEQTFKDQVLFFLDNPRNRDAMKVSTEGMIMQRTKINRETT